MPAENNERKLKAVPKTKNVDQVSDECPKCFGTGMEMVEGKGARICDCRKVRQKTLNLEATNLPRNHARFTFDRYEPKNKSQIIAKEYARNFADAYPAVDRALLFSGGVGIGKTHLAVAMLNRLIERGIRCMFCDYASLLKDIQDSYNPNTQTSELGILAPVLNVEILVLDELGASKPTDWVRDTIAYVINSRYNHHKFTIFTTNYPDVRPSPKEEILEDRIGVRIRSRIFEMCRTVSMAGVDHRTTLDQPAANH